MLPTLAVSILPIPVGFKKLAVPIGKGFTLLFEVAKPVQKFTHRVSPDMEPDGSLINRHCWICSENSAMPEEEN